MRNPKRCSNCGSLKDGRCRSGDMDVLMDWRSEACARWVPQVTETKKQVVDRAEAALAAEYRARGGRPERPGEVVAHRPIKQVEAVQDSRSERGKPMDASTKQTKKESLEMQLSGLRIENEGLRRENTRLQAKVVETEKEYKVLVDTWSAYQAGLNVGKLPRRLDPKEVHHLQAQGEMARTITTKLLRWMNEPEKQDEEE